MDHGPESVPAHERLDPETCYRALASRDRRFDGRFYTGVTTTGVYCRPICPARTPRADHVRFFACAAAAAEAGFRPCLRCHPEAAPGAPAWLLTGATVSRALRLIEAGALDRGGVEHLAATLGVGSRHLRRLFMEQVGASPKTVATTWRAHFAKRLIDETAMPMTEVALASGFRSVRRFSAAIRSAFRRSAGELRRRNVADRSASGLRMSLSYREPYDWHALLAFLRARAIPGVEEVSDGTYRRTFRSSGGPGIVEVRRDGASKRILVAITDPPRSSDLSRVVLGIRRLFDLDADPRSILEVLRRDPGLLPLVRRRPGLRVPGAFDGFELAIRAILGQEVSVAAATTFAGRLVQAFGEPSGLRGASPLTHLFPTPERLAAADATAIGLPRARAATIRGLAGAVVEGRVTFDPSSTGAASLRDIAGIGDWTAQYIAMRALGEPDAFPAGDLGLRRAVARSGEPVSTSSLRRRADAWRPWRAYAAIHLWTGDSTIPQEDR